MTPLLSVNPENGVYVCHRCGREGSVHTFLTDELGHSKKQAYDEIHGTSPGPQPEKKKDKPHVWPRSCRSPAKENPARLFANTAGRMPISGCSTRPVTIWRTREGEPANGARRSSERLGKLVLYGKDLLLRARRRRIQRRGGPGAPGDLGRESGFKGFFRSPRRGSSPA